MRRTATIALACVVAVGALALFEDATTIRLVPDFSLLLPQSRSAFPGEMIDVQLGYLFAPPRSSNPNVVAPLHITSQPSGGYFIAIQPGEATLQAVSIRLAGSMMVSVLWRVDVKVRLPGT